jgi:YVTN family beta-propeller protein
MTTASPSQGQIAHRPRVLIGQQATRAPVVPFAMLHQDPKRVPPPAVPASSRDDDADMYRLVVSLTSGTVEHAEQVWQYPLKPAVSPDGTAVYVPLHDQHEIQVFDGSGRPVSSLAVPAKPPSIAPSADGRTGYVADHESGVVTAWNLSDHTQIDPPMQAGHAPHRVALSADGSQLAVVAYMSNQLLVFSTADHSVQATTPFGAHPQDVAYAPDGRHVYTVDLDDDTLSVVNVQTHAVATVPTGHQPTSIVPRPGRQPGLIIDSEPADGALVGGSVALFTAAG